MSDIKLNEDEQAVVAEQLEVLWAQSQTKAAANAIAALWRAVWPRRDFPESRWKYRGPSPVEPEPEEDEEPEAEEAEEAVAEEAAPAKPAKPAKKKPAAKKKK